MFKYKQLKNSTLIHGIAYLYLYRQHRISNIDHNLFIRRGLGVPSEVSLLDHFTDEIVKSEISRRRPLREQVAVW